MTAADELDEDLVGRCYTKARRAPLVHGVVRSVNGGPNFRLPFGPYTLTQLATIVVSVGLLVLSRPLWGGHGPLDLGVLVVVPFGAAFAMRHLAVDGRNPAAAVASVAVMLAGPRWGRIHGRPLRPARPCRAAPRVTLTGPEDADVAPVAPRTRARVRMPLPAPAPVPASVAGGDAPPGQQAPASMASGVQALLARRNPGTN